MLQRSCSASSITKPRVAMKPMRSLLLRKRKLKQRKQNGNWKNRRVLAPCLKSSQRKKVKRMKSSSCATLRWKASCGVFLQMLNAGLILSSLLLLSSCAWLMKPIVQEKLVALSCLDPKQLDPSRVPPLGTTDNRSLLIENRDLRDFALQCEMDKAQARALIQEQNKHRSVTPTESAK